MRTDKGLTLTQLAAQLDLDSANLSKIENGKRPFDEKRLPKLAAALGLEAAALMTEYYSSLFAWTMYQSNCPEAVLELAKQKLGYLRQQGTRQIEIKF